MKFKSGNKEVNSGVDLYMGLNYSTAASLADSNT